ncbi:MAG: hypothetical protein WKF40_02815 [Thermoleophilaceae bacterium]
MSFGQATALVARREITERIRQRSFLVSSAVTLLIVAAAAVLPALLGGGPTTYDVGVVGSQPRAVAGRRRRGRVRDRREDRREAAARSGEGREAGTRRRPGRGAGRAPAGGLRRQAAR